jgi:hypothetical protein
MSMSMRMRPVLAVAALLASGAGACTARAATSGSGVVEECAVASSAGRYVIVDPAGAQALGAEPFLARCRLPASAMERLRAGAGGAVLWVEGLGPPPEDGATVHVRLGEAGRFAGSFTLLPAGDGGSPARVQVPLGGALAEALDEEGEIVVSLVAVDRAGRPEASSLVFGRLVLELP